MTTPEQLAALDNAAIQGLWVESMLPPTDGDPALVASAGFIVALVNLYRTGQLVPVPSVESVKVALLAVNEWLFEDEAEGLATAVINAMKDRT